MRSEQDLENHVLLAHVLSFLFFRRFSFPLVENPCTSSVAAKIYLHLAQSI